MAEFKNGQKVIRTSSDYAYVKRGSIYTVKYQNGPSLYLMEVGGEYDPLFFLLIDISLDNSVPMEFLN